MSQGGIAHRGDQVIAEAAVQAFLLDDAALDNADQECLTHVLDVVRVFEKHAEVSLDRGGIAHHELDRILNQRPARGNLLDPNARPIV